MKTPKCFSSNVVKIVLNGSRQVQIRLLGKYWLLYYTFLVALHVGTNSSSFKDGTTKITVVALHLLLSVVISEERVDEWHPYLYSEVRVSNIRQNTEEPYGVLVVFLRPSKHSGIITPLFPDSILPHHFQAIINLSSNHSTLYSPDIDLVVKWKKKMCLLSDCAIIFFKLLFF